MAEEITFGKITTGAESDIQQATQIARGHGGAVGDERGGRLRGRPAHRRRRARSCPASSAVSEATQRLVDSEVRRIIDEAHDEVRNLLERERDKLDALAEALLREETLDEADAYRAAGIDRVARAGVTRLGDLVARALAEDVGAGDLTAAAVVPEDARAVAP